MKSDVRNVPQHGDVRIVKKFALFPTHAYVSTDFKTDVAVWFEPYYLVQQYSSHWDSSGWESTAPFLNLQIAGTYVDNELKPRTHLRVIK